MTTGPGSRRLLVPVSLGEIVDKITILEIKCEKILDQSKVAHVKAELEALQSAYHDYVGDVSEMVAKVTERLRTVNLALWDIEDRIRHHERAEDFGDGFIRLARSVYIMNDERAQLKREINLTLGSTFMEEKSYAAYRVAPRQS